MYLPVGILEQFRNIWICNILEVPVWIYNVWELYFICSILKIQSIHMQYIRNIYMNLRSGQLTLYLNYKM